MELELQENNLPHEFTRNMASDRLAATKMLDAVEKLDRDQWVKTNFLESMKACLSEETYKNYGAQSPLLGMWDIYQKVVCPLEQGLLAMLDKDATFKDLEQELSGTAPLGELTLHKPTVKTLVQTTKL